MEGASSMEEGKTWEKVEQVEKEDPERDWFERMVGEGNRRSQTFGTQRNLRFRLATATALG